MWNNFHNPFSVAGCFYNELQKTLLYNPPPTSNVLPHYFVKFERSTVQLCTIVIQFQVWQTVFTVNVYRNAMFWIICWCQLIYNITGCVQSICHQQISTRACFASCTPLCQWMRQWRVVAVLCQQAPLQFIVLTWCQMTLLAPRKDN